MSFKPTFMINAKSATEVDILIYGIIGDTWYSDGNPGKKFVQDFKELEKKYDRINVRINSPGGSVHDGLPMFNAIKSSKKDTHTYNDGIAYSMGAMLALAGKTIHSAQGSLWMLHNVSGGAIGNAKDMRKAADDMDIYDEVLGQLIASRTGKTTEAVKKEFMNYEDNFMSATTAHENKLVDVLETYEASDVPDNINDLDHAQIMAYYTPANKDVSGKTTNEPSDQVSEPTNQIQQTENMGLFGSDFPKLNSSAGKAAGVVITAEEIKGINAEFKEKGINNLVVIGISDLTEANNNADAITNGLSAINAILGTGNVKATLSEAITAFVALQNTTATSLKAVTKERDEAKKLAEEYGEQPGALGTQTQTNAAENEQQVEEGAPVTPKTKTYETSYDRELKAKMKNVKTFEVYE